MDKLQSLIAWIKVERAGAYENYIYNEHYGNDYARFGYGEQCKAFDHVIKAAELILKEHQKTTIEV